MSAPLEVVAAPFTIYLAAVGTTAPDVDETPSVAWTKLGTSGDKNYTEDGVTFAHSQSLATFTPVGTTVPRKVWRESEGLMCEFQLADMSTAQYAKIINDATVTTTPVGTGVPGTKSFDLLQGSEVALFALLARGISPEEEGMAAQYQIPIVYQAANPAPVGKKGTPQLLACQFAVLEDDTYGIGKWVAQTADAS